MTSPSLNGPAAGTIAIIAVGSEILDGRVLDTNSHWLAGKLEERGLKLAHVHVCDDIESEISAAIEFVFRFARTIIISGGLGPTSDDLTREAISGFTGRALRLDTAVLDGLREMYRARRRALDESNHKQAMFPEGAEIIPNPVGTAAGFIVPMEGEGACELIALPGVPGEFKRMVEDVVLPRLERRLGARAAAGKSVLRVFGLPESTVGERVSAAGLHAQSVVSYRAAFPEIQVIVRNDDPALAGADGESALRGIGSEFVFSRDLSIGLEQTVQALLQERGLTVAVAESCTGGLLGSLLTASPGASKHFVGGVLAYSNEIKSSLLNVAPHLLERHGAVSAQVAAAMASGAKSRCKSDIGIAVTGIAGPDGGSETKPVGLFYIGLATENDTIGYKYFYSSTRFRVRSFAAHTALDVLRRHLLDLPLTPESLAER